MVPNFTASYIFKTFLIGLHVSKDKNTVVGDNLEPSKFKLTILNMFVMLAMLGHEAIMNSSVSKNFVLKIEFFRVVGVNKQNYLFEEQTSPNDVMILIR